MAIVTFPPSLQRFTETQFTIDWRGQSAGVGVGGNDQEVNIAFPRWEGQLKLRMPPTLISQWRAVMSTLQDRRNILRLPMVDPVGFDILGAAATDGVSFQTGLPFSGGQNFANGLGFAYAPFALNVGAAAAGATEIVVSEASTTTGITVGQRMSHDDWPFEVLSKLAEGSNYRITIAPGLRAAIPDGGILRLQAVGRFRVEQKAPPTKYDANRVADYSLSVVEVLTR